MTIVSSYSEGIFASIKGSFHRGDLLTMWMRRRQSSDVDIVHYVEEDTSCRPHGEELEGGKVGSSESAESGSKGGHLWIDVGNRKKDVQS